MTDWIDFTAQYPVGAGTELVEQKAQHNGGCQPEHRANRQ